MSTCQDSRQIHWGAVSRFSRLQIFRVCKSRVVSNRIRVGPVYKLAVRSLESPTLQQCFTAMCISGWLFGVGGLVQAVGPAHADSEGNTLNATSREKIQWSWRF